MLATSFACPATSEQWPSAAAGHRQTSLFVMVLTGRQGLKPENGQKTTNDGWRNIAADVRSSLQTTYVWQGGA